MIQWLYPTGQNKCLTTFSTSLRIRMRRRSPPRSQGRGVFPGVLHQTRRAADPPRRVGGRPPEPWDEEVKVMKRVLALMVGVILLVATAGQAAEKVVVMVRTGVEADAIRAVAQAYTKATGRPVEMMEIGRWGYYATLHTQLVAGTDAFDLAQANDVDVGVLAEAKTIAPIGPYLNDPRHTDPKTFHPKDIAFTYRYKGQ